jgi:hypothetical protein
LSDELDIDVAGVAVLVDDVIADLLDVGEKTPDLAKAGSPGWWRREGRQCEVFPPLIRTNDWISGDVGA